MQKSILYIFLLVLFIGPSCKDKIVSNKENADIKKDMSAGDGWTLLKEIHLPGYDITGMSSFKHLIFISDSIKNEFVQLTTSGDIEKVFSIQNPQGIQSANARMIVAATGSDSIYVYRGKELYPLKVFVDIDGPVSVDAIRIDHYAVADQSHRVFYARGKEDNIILGGKGSESGKFNQPRSVILKEDLLYVLDSGNKRVQVFDRDGKVVSIFGEEDEMQFPTGMTMDEKRTYISDSKANKIWVYNSDGLLIQTLDKFLDGPIAINYLNSLLYIANRNSSTITILKRDHLEG